MIKNGIKTTIFIVVSFLWFWPICGYADSSVTTGGTARVQIRFKIVIPEIISMSIKTSDSTSNDASHRPVVNASGTLNSNQSMVLTQQDANLILHAENGSQSVSYPIQLTSAGPPETYLLAAP